ncbi:MAG: START domain-containing protein [Salinivirgaceae bacterium]|jgi:ribosome-associated toxin RatA of RatAB toxin-antitoxin module|nr:START domain-containing protein [Salinivirgaceae bacterium]
MIRHVVIIIFLFLCSHAFSQNETYDWIFLKESDNISIYYRSSDTLHYEELKFTTIFKTTPAEMVSTIGNIEEIPEWSYLCVGTKLIKKVSPTEWYYYYITDTPWPLDDRDVVLQIKVSKDSISGVTKINAKNRNGMVEEKEGFVRIPKLRSRWEFTPIDKDYTQLEFYFSSDPGGIIPLWLMNSAISYGPIKTLTKLKERVEK